MAMEKGGDSAKKSKKHKKHKKKKKEAITLDEFLNMNKDVFGEGLDFQGIEEVPTQVVAKRLKQKKPEKLKLSNLRVAQSSELEKLKKQGIVIKMKPTKKPPSQNFKIGEKIVTKPTQNVNKPSTVQSTPDEVLSKLINQSNNQIKIFKKTSQDNQESDLQEDPGTSGEEKTIFDKRVSPENIEVECDVNMPSEYTSSENESKEDSVKKGNKPINDDQPASTTICAQNIINTVKKDLNKDQDKPDSQKEQDAVNKDKVSDQIEASSKNEKEFLRKDKNVNDLSAVTALKNTGNITIKPVTKNVLPSSDDISEEKIPKENPIGNAEEDDENISNEADNSTSNSLDALKHLSHLITVKSLNPKRSLTPIPTKQTKITEHKESTVDQDGFDENEDEETIENSKEIPPVQAQIINDKSIDTLNSFKNLNKNITIKPVAQSPKVIPEISHEAEEEDSYTNMENVSAEKVIASNHTIRSATPVKNSDSNVPSPKGHDISKTAKPNIVKDISGTQEKQSSMNLLKHLTNVTAKPVSAVRSNIQQNITNTLVKNITKPQVTQNFVKKQEIEKEIEVFNIDDSDDEPTEPPVNKISSPKPNLTENKPASSLDTLKNISKHITVKPVQQSSQIVNKSTVKQSNPEQIGQSRKQCSISKFSDDDDDQDTLIPTNSNTVQQRLKLQNNHLQNTLKNLSKHITVKSGNPSPNSSIKSGKDHNSRDNFDDAADSDDSFSGKVKITEMTDENSMGDDMVQPSDTINNSEYNENATVKSPVESNSEHEHFDEDEDDEFDDLESQIKANTLKKPMDNLNKVMNYKNINKNVSVKSLADKKGLKEDTNNTTIPKINSELSIKPFKQIKNDCRDDNFANKKSIMNAAQVKRSIINQNQSMNQSVASSSQQNTVNKEVTVKTFQTKTVIQEITTTVTKTIKTVNQTVKQEVQTKSQNNLTKFQKVQGMKTNQQIKNFQGVTVRHATPIAGTKIRGGVPMNIRPSNQLVPCNQLLPVSPVRNTARMSVPRMPGVKKNIMPGTTLRPPRPAIGRPLKISPNAVSTIKRAAEETTGHFSCFKKPKESLIPVSEIPSFGGEQGGESVVHYTSSQMSRSNVTSATKTIRGNKVVTQMKSEVSASSQHLEKLNSMSGLKVVKTSQSKQAMNVVEKCELSPSKRHTLEAIEKLQKQGLLVKKPRLEDVSNESDHSEEGDDYITEEPDD